MRCSVCGQANTKHLADAKARRTMCRTNGFSLCEVLERERGHWTTQIVGKAGLGGVTPVDGGTGGLSRQTCGARMANGGKVQGVQLVAHVQHLERI